GGRDSAGHRLGRLAARGERHATDVAPHEAVGARVAAARPGGDSLAVHSTHARPGSIPVRVMETTRRVRLFGCQIDSLRKSEAVSRVFDLISGSSGSCLYVVRPNVDQAVMLQHDEGLRRAYAGAALELADGMPVV